MMNHDLRAELATFIGCATVVALLLSAAAVACYDPAKLPPCSPSAVYPDPCVSSPRDAGTD